MCTFIHTLTYTPIFIRYTDKQYMRKYTHVVSPNSWAQLTICSGPGPMKPETKRIYKHIFVLFRDSLVQGHPGS